MAVDPNLQRARAGLVGCAALLAGVLLAALLIPPLLARISAEDALPRAHFGSEYEAYCLRTPRLIPGVY